MQSVMKNVCIKLLLQKIHGFKILTVDSHKIVIQSISCCGVNYFNNLFCIIKKKDFYFALLHGP